MKQVLDVIGKGAAPSWQMDNRGKTMTDRQFDFGFAVDWLRKDLGLCLDQARRSGVTLPGGGVIGGPKESDWELMNEIGPLFYTIYKNQLKND